MTLTKSALKSAVAVSALALMVWGGPTQAQTPAASQDTGQLTTIVVTANRRAENLQKVPIVVEMVSGHTALARGVTDTQSLANAVPGLTFNRATVNAIPFLRGVGTPVGQVGIESSIALYIDDVYSPSGGAALSNFNNIDHMEVDKGPQGTLFGRNASGGVVQVFTKDPSPDFSVDANIGYSNYNTPSGSIYATGTIAKNLTANIALYGSDQQDGWGKDLTTGKKIYTSRDDGGRIKFLWKPSDATSVLVNFDHDTSESSEGFYAPVPGSVTDAGLYAAPKNFYDSLDNTNPHGTVKQTGLSIKVNQDLDWAKLTSISAYRYTNEMEIVDEAGGPIPFVNVTYPDGPDTTYTQEFRLSSEVNSKLSWIGGFFFMDEDAGYDPLTLSGVFFPGGAFSGYTDEITHSYAGFGQATATVLPDTHLTMGLRYTMDDRTMTASTVDGAGFSSQAVPNSPQSLQSDKLTWRFSLDHQFTDNIMGYVAYNRGFKSATFNTVVTTGAMIANPVAPEVLDDYSIGERGEFFDHRLRVNAEAFYYQFKNIQINELIAGTSVLSNAASATIKGIDLDTTIEPIHHLTLTADMEVLNGTYNSFPNGLFWNYSPGCEGAPYVNCSTPGGVNLQGYKTIQTPPFSLSLVADYVYPTNFGNYEFNVSYSHGGNYYFDADNGAGQPDPNFDKQPPLNLVNLSLAWTSPTDRYNVRLWGKNITGQQYFAYANEGNFLTQGGPAPPATFGITLGVHFE